MMRVQPPLCHCVTYDNETEELVEGNCIENCENGYEKGEYFPLPLDVTKLNQFMCEERWNRTGRLCGSCLPGHSPLAYSYDMSCVKCPKANRNIWKYILAGFGPTSLFFFIVLIFKIKATSLYLHGYITFCQVIASTPLANEAYDFIRNNESIRVPLQILGAMYTMWNLDFFRDLYHDICLNVSTLTVLALDYAVAIYPLLLIAISYVLIELHARNVRIVVILWKPFRNLHTKLQRKWNGRTTVIDAFATFFLLSFVKITIVSFDLLTPIQTQSLNNKTRRWVLYYDGTIEYFGSEHLPFATLACICLILFIVFPIVLMLVYQCRWFQRMLSCLKPTPARCHGIIPKLLQEWNRARNKRSSMVCRCTFHWTPCIINDIHCHIGYWLYSVWIDLYPMSNDSHCFCSAIQRQQCCQNGHLILGYFSNIL